MNLFHDILFRLISHLFTIPDSDRTPDTRSRQTISEATSTFLREITRHDYPICIAAYSCFLRVSRQGRLPLEIDSSLFGIRFLVDKQPATQVSETVSFVCKFYRTFAANLTVEQID